MPKDSHHGENIHKMEQVPERLASPKSQGSLTSSRENLPPAEIKRLTHPAATKKQANKRKKAQA